jgi:hypothetical protein
MLKGNFMKRYFMRILSAVFIIILPLAAVYRTSHHSINFDNISIVDGSNYGTDMGEYAGPGPGGYIIAPGLKEALKDPDNDNSYFYVIIDIRLHIPINLNSDYETRISEYVTKRSEYEKKEIRRLSALGLCVFYSEHWSYTGKEKTRIYYQILTRLLTKEQLLNFPASNECSYHFEWVTNGDSSYAVPDFEMLDEIY